MPVPQLGAAIINAASGAISTGASLAAQKKENQRNREYNLMLANKQNQWNFENWQMNNAYNSPAAQKARLEAAGLNADMMYGQGGISNISSSAPESTAGAPSSPMDWSSLASVNPVGTYLDAKLKQAQIDNINADTKKKGHEAGILASDEAFRDAWNSGLLATQNVEIRVKSSSADLNEQKIKESQAFIQQIDANISEINAQIERWRTQSLNESRSLEIQSRLSDAQIKDYAASSNLKLEQAYSINQQLEPLIRQIESQTRNSDADTDLKSAQTIKVGNEDVKLSYENGMLKIKADYADTLNSIGNIKGLTNYIKLWFGALF